MFFGTSVICFVGHLYMFCRTSRYVFWDICICFVGHLFMFCGTSVYVL